ncbi:MAG: Rpn family recombination-promoting nuclease/putative transposase [Desulfovermiculus sp.]
MSVVRGGLEEKARFALFTDLVFSVMMRGEGFPSARVYLLFEHKSSPETLVGMQILRYMAMQ